MSYRRLLSLLVAVAGLVALSTVTAPEAQAYTLRHYRSGNNVGCLDAKYTSDWIVRVSPCHGGDSQLWRETQLTGSTVILANQAVNKCMSYANTTTVVLRNCDTTIEKQRWSKYDQGNYYIFFSEYENNHRCLRAPGATNNPVFTSSVNCDDRDYASMRWFDGD